MMLPPLLWCIDDVNMANIMPMHAWILCLVWICHLTHSVSFFHSLSPSLPFVNLIACVFVFFWDQSFTTPKLWEAKLNLSIFAQFDSKLAESPFLSPFYGYAAGGVVVVVVVGKISKSKQQPFSIDVLDLLACWTWCLTQIQTKLLVQIVWKLFVYLFIFYASKIQFSKKKTDWLNFHHPHGHMEICATIFIGIDSLLDELNIMVVVEMLISFFSRLVIRFILDLFLFCVLLFQSKWIKINKQNEICI